MTLISDLSPSDLFARRHIGPGEAEISEMLRMIGAASLDELADQTVPESIRLRTPLALGEPAGEHELRGASRPHDARQEVARPHVAGRQPDADELRREERVVACDPEVGGEGEREPTADGGTVHGGDHGLRQLVDREHQLGEVLLHHLHQPDGPAIARPRRQLVVTCQVGARAEAAPGAGQHDRARRTVLAQVAQVQPEQAREAAIVERAARARPQAAAAAAVAARGAHHRARTDPTAVRAWRGRVASLPREIAQVARCAERAHRLAVASTAVGVVIATVPASGRPCAAGRRMCAGFRQRADAISRGRSIVCIAEWFVPQYSAQKMSYSPDSVAWNQAFVYLPGRTSILMRKSGTKKLCSTSCEVIVSSTGRSTGPHLHYETRIGGDAVDPLRFLTAGEILETAMVTLP